MVIPSRRVREFVIELNHIKTDRIICMKGRVSLGSAFYFLLYIHIKIVLKNYILQTNPKFFTTLQRVDSGTQAKLYFRSIEPFALNIVKNLHKIDSFYSFCYNDMEIQIQI